MHVCIYVYVYIGLTRETKRNLCKGNRRAAL